MGKMANTCPFRRYISSTRNKLSPIAFLNSITRNGPLLRRSLRICKTHYVAIEYCLLPIDYSLFTITVSKQSSQLSHFPLPKKLLSLVWLLCKHENFPC